MFKRLPDELAFVLNLKGFPPPTIVGRQVAGS